MNTQVGMAIFDPKSSFNSAKISGTVVLIQDDLSTKTSITFNLSGLKPNRTLGCHIHRLGDLSKGCESTCEHYNPHNKFHGSQELYGTDRHVGDLCNNITSDSRGNVNFTYYDDLVDLSGPFSVIGRTIVIHQDEDDRGMFRYEDSKRGEGSRTTGNAGKRIACSVIGISDFSDRC